MRLTFVTTVYNRIESVRLHLRSLENQSEPDFHVVVADDGSTEDIHGLVQRSNLAITHLRALHDERLLGVKTRNRGCANVPPDTTHIWLTDGDIVFNPQAVAWAYRHLQSMPKTVIAGRYDWMPRMDVTQADITLRFDDFVHCRLPLLPMDPESQGGARKMLDGRNSDPRSEECFTDCTKTYGCKGGILGSNVIVPIEAWVQTGGYDENMPPACNAGDCEFGHNLALHGWKNIYCPHIIGYHLYHERDTLALTLGVRQGIVYMSKKYGYALDYAKHLPKLPPGVTDEFSHLEGA